MAFPLRYVTLHFCNLHPFLYFLCSSFSYFFLLPLNVAFSVSVSYLPVGHLFFLSLSSHFLSPSDKIPYARTTTSLLLLPRTCPHNISMQPHPRSNGPSSWILPRELIYGRLLCWAASCLLGIFMGRCLSYFMVGFFAGPPDEGPRPVLDN